MPVRFFLPDGVFLPPCVTTGWIFDISFGENSINQINQQLRSVQLTLILLLFNRVEYWCVILNITLFLQSHL